MNKPPNSAIEQDCCYAGLWMVKTNFIMEDINDNLPTEGKRYYMSHSEYFYSKKEKDNIYSSMPISIRNEIYFSEPMKLSQLVCASNLEKAREAVKNQLEKSGKYIVTKCRIDYLIVGD